MTAHAQLPWRADGTRILDTTGSVVVKVERPRIDDYSAQVQAGKELTSFIVRAVNAHEALVNALARALPYVEHCDDSDQDLGYKEGAVAPIVKLVREALKLAGQ